MYEDKTVFKVDKVRVSPPDVDADGNPHVPEWLLLDVSINETILPWPPKYSYDFLALPYTVKAFNELRPQPDCRSIWFVVFLEGVMHSENNVNYKVIQSYQLRDELKQQLP